MLDHLARFFRKRVEVRANGIIYRGLLIGADEDMLYMIGTTCYLILPLEVVTAVKDEGEDEAGWVRRELAGAPPRDPEALEEKRRYRKDDLTRRLSTDAAEDWPRWPSGKKEE